MPSQSWTSRRRVAVAGLFIALGMLLAAFLVLMLTPVQTSYADYDVPFDPDGPIAQRFKVGTIEGWITRMPDGSVDAYSAAAPGRRCRVEYISTDDPLYAHRAAREEYPNGFFFDRCFFSTFTLDGDRTFGPAPRGLDEFEVHEVRNGRAFLDLTRMQLGKCGEGVAAASYCSTTSRPQYGSPSAIDPDLTARFPWPLY